MSKKTALLTFLYRKELHQT